MAHRKADYEAAGHDVTVQQVNEGGDVSAWIDGKAAYADRAVDETPIIRPADEPNQWDTIRKVVAFMVENDVLFCKQCDTFYDCTDSYSTGFAGHQCGDCARSDAECPDSPTGGHEDECLNSSQKHNARVPTKYRCVHCGRKRQTTPTG